LLLFMWWVGGVFYGVLMYDVVCVVDEGSC